jgi:hypothetical protein
MPTYGSQTITLLIFTTIPPITHSRKWCGGAYLHHHPKLRLIPSTLLMYEEGRERKWGNTYFKIYFFMMSTLRLAAILDGLTSRTKAGKGNGGDPTLKFISLWYQCCAWRPSWMGPSRLNTTMHAFPLDMTAWTGSLNEFQCTGI